MKRVICLLAILVLPVLAYAESENGIQRPEIRFTTETYDLGEVKDEVVVHSFEFKNTGSSMLIIERIVPS